MSFDYEKYKTTLSGSYYSYRNPDFPLAGCPEKDGRFHHFNTGSIYFGDSQRTCEAETSASPDFCKRKLYECNLSGAVVIDLFQAEESGEDIRQFLQESGSNGWVLTLEFSKSVFAEKYSGIRSPSTKYDGGENVVIYKEHFPLTDGDFHEVPVSSDVDPDPK